MERDRASRRRGLSFFSVVGHTGKRMVGMNGNREGGRFQSWEQCPCLPMNCTVNGTVTNEQPVCLVTHQHTTTHQQTEYNMHSFSSHSPFLGRHTTVVLPVPHTHTVNVSICLSVPMLLQNQPCSCPCPVLSVPGRQSCPLNLAPGYSCSFQHRGREMSTEIQNGNHNGAQFSKSALEVLPVPWKTYVQGGGMPACN